jgi:hypothetical protein
MLVIVAVNAEQLPVATVRRVVVVVVVLVVDGELAHVGVVELTRAASADPRKQFQRLAAVTLLALIVGASCRGERAIEALEVRTGILLSSGPGGRCRVPRTAARNDRTGRPRKREVYALYRRAMCVSL